MIILIIGALLGYDPTFDSLNSRPFPSWFQDAKFGIFIHMGVYSVPGWSPVGSYAEWYQYWYVNRHTSGNLKPDHKQVYQHHVEDFGLNFSYYDFAKNYSASKFDPDAWASLFQSAGAKYIVYTTKHHQGFANWNSSATDKAWGFPWNSVSTGSGKDLIKLLKTAVDKTSVKFGIYYSLFQWYNPLYQTNVSRYVAEVAQTHLRQLVQKYEPWVIWSDGEWQQTTKTWDSLNFLAWLYTNSSIKDKVVVNGRWGNDITNKGPFVGNFISLQFDGGSEQSRPWEECRAIGYSFGYNRNQDINDYNTAQVLTLNLIDRVSYGGNMLLDIGPMADGTIPAIQQQRLLQMGSWLKINGQAIYGTRKYIQPVQWSAGRIVDAATYKRQHNLTYLGGDFILKQTIDPDPGCAVKQIFFTSRNSTIYLIVPIWNQTVTVKNYQIFNRKVSLLENGLSLTYKLTQNDTVITLPPFSSAKLKSQWAWVIKIL